MISVIKGNDIAIPSKDLAQSLDNHVQDIKLEIQTFESSLYPTETSKKITDLINELLNCRDRLAWDYLEHLDLG